MKQKTLKGQPMESKGMEKSREKINKKYIYVYNSKCGLTSYFSLQDFSAFKF